MSNAGKRGVWLVLALGLAGCVGYVEGPGYGPDPGVVVEPVPEMSVFGYFGGGREYAHYGQRGFASRRSSGGGGRGGGRR